MMNSLYVISGGPGSGKTSLLSYLREHGHRTISESGRAIIQNQIAVGGSALPWADRRAFAELMLQWELCSYHQAVSMGGTIFFDRGIPDILGYLQVCNLEIPPHISAAADKLRYNRKVFLAPPWREIFCEDAERKQSWEESVSTFEAIQSVYNSLGYETMLLPFAPIEERATFILKDIVA